jgi:predicted ATPase
VGNLDPAGARTRFVVTGGPGAGKTTLIEALCARGYEHAPDSARAIIQRRKAAGLSARPAPEEFGREMLRLDIDAYRAVRIGEDPIFFDRSVLDALAFLDQHAAVREADVREHVEAFRYHETVFVLPPWKEIYTKDAERDQDFHHSLGVYERLCRWYQRWSYTTCEVPRVSVEERMDFVLGCIERAPETG